MPFSQIVGHQQLLGLLSRGISRDSLPPSLIFEGPAGVGKRLAAIALAQTVNCEAPVRAADSTTALSIDACGRCRPCLRIARGVHSDVLLLTPGETGNISIDQVRVTVDRAAFRPFEGRRRVVIIDQAEALLRPAQNALLKTLEEPPSASVFVLVTAQPDLLLPTVRSRCPRLRFGPLSTSDVTQVLVEAHGIERAEASAAAAGAGGSVGRALEEREGEFAEARARAARLLEGLAGQPDPRGKLERAKEFAGASPKGQASADRDQLARSLAALGGLLRDLQVVSSRADERWLANIDLGPALERLAKAFDQPRAIRAFSAVDRALEALDRNASPKIVADWLAFQL